MPEPRDPDLPPVVPSPEYDPAGAPEEIPSEPPVEIPDDGRPRDLSAPGSVKE